jgi:hypothetical protein
MLGQQRLWLVLRPRQQARYFPACLLAEIQGFDGSLGEAARVRFACKRSRIGVVPLDARLGYK